MLAPLLGSLVNERTLLDDRPEISSCAFRFTQASGDVTRWQLDIWSTGAGNGQRSLVGTVITSAPGLGARTSRIVAIATVPGTVRWDVTATVFGQPSPTARAELQFSASNYMGCCGVEGVNDGMSTRPCCEGEPGPPGPQGDPGTPGTPGLNGAAILGSALLAVDSSTAAAAFADLLTVAVVTTGNVLGINASFSASHDLLLGLARGQFRVLVDGMAIAGAGVAPPVLDAPESGAITIARVVAPGPHTVKLQWARVAPGGTLLLIRPVTMPDDEHASLVVTGVP